MEDILNNIYNYIILYAPIVSSIIGSVVTIGVAIKRIKDIRNDNALENAQLRESIRKANELNSRLMIDNAELKEQMVLMMRDNHNVHTTKKVK